MNVTCVYYEKLDNKLCDFVDKLSKRLFEKYNKNISFEMVNIQNIGATDDCIIILSNNAQNITFKNFLSKKSKSLNTFAKVDHIFYKDFSHSFVISDYNKNIKYEYRQGKFGRECVDTLSFGELEIERIARISYEMAEHYNNTLQSVDGSDIFESQRLFRKIVHDINEDYPAVTLNSVSLKDFVISKNNVILTNILYGDVITKILSKDSTFSTTYFTSDLNSAIYKCDISDDYLKNIINLSLLISDVLRNSFELYDIADNLQHSTLLKNANFTENLANIIIENM